MSTFLLDNYTADTDALELVVRRRLPEPTANN